MIIQLNLFHLKTLVRETQHCNFQEGGLFVGLLDSTVLVLAQRDGVTVTVKAVSSSVGSVLVAIFI